MTEVALAAPHRLAVAAGEQAVRAGGNALDAALAAAMVLTVVYPHQCSLGGDLSALVRSPDGEVTAVLSLGASAAAIDVAMIRSRGRMPRQGPLTVTVPGAVAGWIELSRLGARFPLARPLRAAAALADAGCQVSAGLARAIGDRIAAVRADPGLSALLLDAAGNPRTGRLLQPQLARTLDQLAEDPDGFYRGAVAERLAAGLARLGSPLTREDLAAHRAERAEPLTLATTDAHWWAAPPPAQGATVLALLAEPAGASLLNRARAAHRARATLLGDPAGGEIDIAGLRAPGRDDGDDVRAAIAGERVGGDTVAVTAVDADGTCVSLIQSVFQSFGAGLLEPDTGIVLHNRGSAFVVLDDPDAHARHPAALAPRRRPPHTLCPLIGEGAGGAVRVALGCQGGRAQPLILAQVAADTADPASRLSAVLSRPRWVVGDRDLGFDTETVLAEPGAQPYPSVAPPAGAGASVAATLPVFAAPEGGDDRCGHVQVARITGSKLEAAADPRADGSAVVTRADNPGGQAP